MLPENGTETLSIAESTLLNFLRQLNEDDRQLIVAAMRAHTLYGTICCVAAMSPDGQQIAAHILDLLAPEGTV